MNLVPSRNNCVRAEEECGSDGEPSRPATVFQDVVEQVVVDHVALQADGEVAGQDKVYTTTKSVEARPIRLLPGGHEELHDRGRDRIVGLRRGRLAYGAEGGAHEERDVLEVAEGQQWSHGERLGERMRRHREHKTRRHQASELLLERDGQQTRGERRVASRIRVIEAHRIPSAWMHRRLQVEAVFKKSEVRAVQKGVAGGKVVARDVRLLAEGGSDAHGENSD